MQIKKDIKKQRLLTGSIWGTDVETENKSFL